MSDDAPITTEALTRRFGSLRAVDGVDLRVEGGRVFALAGRNGAGKTTLIRMLLGLLRPTSGSARVLGLDPLKKDVAIRRRVGYVPETHHVYPWMKVREVLWFCASFYPTWDDAHARELLDRFDLDRRQRIRELSRGGVAKVALTIALAHRPPLLVLDEPTSGLDVIVRREFLESIVRLISEEGRTVLISSHLLADVERVADRIAFMEEGRLVLTEDLDALQERFRRVTCVFPGVVPEGIMAEGIRRTAREGRRWEIVFDRFAPDSLPHLRRSWPDADISEQTMSLEEIFIELAGKARAQAAPQEV